MLIIVAMLGLLSGCSNMIFYPLRQHVIDPADRGVNYESIHVETGDHQLLHGWMLPPQGELKGTVVYFHGNGENISTHIGAVYWLPQFGYRVILVDYRGYGQSQGQATLDNAIVDINATIAYVMQQYADHDPVIIMGQSLGASMTVYAVATSEYKKNIAALILVSAFSDYHRIVREALAKSWMTWLFQYPLSWTVSNEYRPLDFITAVNPVPVYFIHGTKDNLVVPDHAFKLYEQALPPKELFWIDAGHNDLANQQSYRDLLIKILQQITAPTPSGSD